MAKARMGRLRAGHNKVRASAFSALGIGATALLALSTGRATAAGCEDLASLQLQDTRVTVAETVPAGSFTPPGATAPITNLPEFCRVAGVIAPTSDSSIGFEVWLPTGWNGRYLQSGNGGFAGAIPYAALGKGKKPLPMIS